MPASWAARHTTVYLYISRQLQYVVKLWITNLCHLQWIINITASIINGIISTVIIA